MKDKYGLFNLAKEVNKEIVAEKIRGLIREIPEEGLKVDWRTLQLIIKAPGDTKGINPFAADKEKEDDVYWSIAIKFEAEKK